MSHDNLTYDDLLRIVELIKTSEQFSEFRLKIGEIEIELRRRSAPGAPVANASLAPPSSSMPAAVLPESPAGPPQAVRDAPTWPAGLDRYPLTERSIAHPGLARVHSSMSAKSWNPPRSCASSR